MLDLIVEFVDCDDEFWGGVLDLFGEFGYGVLRVGGGGDGADGHDGEEGDGETDGVGGEDEDDVFLGDVEVDQGAGEV